MNRAMYHELKRTGNAAYSFGIRLKEPRKKRFSGIRILKEILTGDKSRIQINISPIHSKRRSFYIYTHTHTV
jgi:hypothetical protein